MSEHKNETAETIRNLIDQFYARQDGAVLRELLTVLLNATVSVPMNVIMEKEDEEQFLGAKPGDTVTTRQAIRMKPDMLKNGAGELLFPVFTQPEDAPEDYRKYFSWVTMDFMRCVRSAFHNEECSGVVINAFSTAFPLNKLILQLLINQAEADSNKGDFK